MTGKPNPVTDAQAHRTGDIEFLALMAHDLRQPLNVVLGMAIALDEHWSELTDERRRRHVSLISRSAAWMKSIVDDMVTAGDSVAGVGSSEAVSFCLTLLISETIHDLAPEDERRFRLSFAEPPELPFACGDPVTQRKVFQNLLDNALKYSRSETPIDVGVSVRKNMLSVTVADRGIGIAASDVPTIFEKYARITDSEHHVPIEGSGLGLFVCRAIVEKQGGEIGLESNSHGVGSVFTYSLPIAHLRER